MINIELSEEETDCILEIVKAEYVLAMENQKFQHAKLIQGIIDAIED